ncbi:TRAP transporter large permease subunit [Spirochaetota bacterium]
MNSSEKKDKLHHIAFFMALLSAAFLSLVPILDLILARVFWKGIPSAAQLQEHSLVALAFLAAAVASLTGKHLVLGKSPASKAGFARVLNQLKTGILITIDLCLFIASISLLLNGFEPGDKIFGLSKAVFASPMAIGLFIMTVQDIRDSKAFLTIMIGIIAAVLLSSPVIMNIFGFFGLYPDLLGSVSDTVMASMLILKIPIIVLLIILAFLGLPLYAVISGSAMLLFLGAFSALELIPSEAYNLLRNDSMPAIPLFTLAGFVLSESEAGKRLVSVFREWFSWLPGGEAFAAVLVCAFFTTFTGANGVAILALGGILSLVLTESSNYSEDFSHGFLTASSSIGLLFPPSMAVIIYAINATFIVQGSSAFTIGDMFLGGILPGLMFVLAMAAFGVNKSIKSGSPRNTFNGKTAIAALWKALPEIIIPFIILVFYLSGFATITEIGAIILVYVILLEAPVRKDLSPKEVLSAVAKALPVAGGALIIIAAARALSFYTMMAGLPELFTEWISNVVSSRFMFLLLLNLALLVVGCFMDIFSAVLVVSPMVIPLGAVYGVHPVHLGVIFIANLSIGFLTPPIGMNLFLASYAFNKPVMRIYKDVFPFFLAQLAVLALVTWIPWLSLVFVPSALN